MTVLGRVAYYADRCLNSLLSRVKKMQPLNADSCCRQPNLSRPRQVKHCPSVLPTYFTWAPASLIHRNAWLMSDRNRSNISLFDSYVVVRDLRSSVEVNFIPSMFHPQRSLHTTHEWRPPDRSIRLVILIPLLDLWKWEAAWKSTSVRLHSELTKPFTSVQTDQIEKAHHLSQRS